MVSDMEDDNSADEDSSTSMGGTNANANTRSIPATTLQSFLDDACEDDDESDYEVVSTAKHRLDRRFSFDPKSEEEEEEEHADVILVSSKQKPSVFLELPKKSTGTTRTSQRSPKTPLFLLDEEEDDFIVVVSKQSAIDDWRRKSGGMMKDPIRSGGGDGRGGGGLQQQQKAIVVVLLVGFLLSAGFLLWYFVVRIKKKSRQKVPERVMTTATATLNSPSTSSRNINQQSPTCSLGKSDEMKDEGSNDVTKESSPTSLSSPSSTSRRCEDYPVDGPPASNNLVCAGKPPVAIPSLCREPLPADKNSKDPSSPSQQSEITETTNEQDLDDAKQIVPTNSTNTPLFLDDDDSSLARQQTIQAAANQLVQDIKLVEQVFQEKGLDTSLASQVVVTLHSSRHLVVEQERLEMQRLMLEAHQKHLDRQLSLQEQQHHHHQHGVHTTVTTALYDPNWKDKLRDRRDQCWTAACRLIWEVVLAHAIVKLAKPLLRQFYGRTTRTTYGDTHYYSSLSSTGRIVQFLLTNLCNCNETSDPLLGTSYSSWLCYATSIFDMYWHSWGWESPSVVLEQGACYGYCLLSLGTISMVALVMHQLLRAFSAPAILHHATNAAALLLVYGSPTPNDLMDLVHEVWRERPELVLLVSTSIGGMLTVVQLKYQTHRQSVSKCQPTDFRATWEQCLDAMDSLHFQISLTRYAALSIFFGILWVHSHNHSDDDSSLAIREATAVEVIVT